MPELRIAEGQILWIGRGIVNDDHTPPDGFPLLVTKVVGFVDRNRVCVYGDQIDPYEPHNVIVARRVLDVPWDCPLADVRPALPSRKRRIATLGEAPPSDDRPLQGPPPGFRRVERSDTVVYA